MTALYSTASRLMKEKRDIYRFLHVTPRRIFEQLDQYVVGQRLAKEVLAIAAYNHLKRIEYLKFGGDVSIRKSNILLIGPSGSGKTYLARTLARVLDVPFAYNDATAFTEAGYYGEDVEVAIGRLLYATNQNVDKAESGIVFIDEIDKIATKADRGGADVSREGVQRDLLPIVEGSTVTTKYGPVRTDHVLFIAAGAFHMAKPSDLIPEMQGRFPIRVELTSLGADEFVRILTEPKNALTRQYAALLATEGITIEWTDGAVRELAKIAADVNQRTHDIGARRLHTVLERLLDDLLYNAPDIGAQTIPITQQYVTERLGALVADEDLTRYIL